MNRTQLLQNFDTLAETPDAVKKLRGLILELAVRGKLVPSENSPDKTPAWVSFCREIDERLYGDQPFAGYDPASSASFEIPEHWRWVVLDDVAASCGQIKPAVEFSYIDVGAIDNERGVIKEKLEVIAPGDAPSRARKLVVQNAVLYSTVRPYLKNIAIIDRKFSPPAIASTAFAVLSPKEFLNPRYLYYWLRSPSFQAVVESKMKGVAYPAISDSEFWECLIPVPPLAEQRRIVAKVEELLALSDELEARQTAAREHRTRLVRSAFDHLTTAPTESEFRQHADFVLQNSNLLLNSVSDLRKVVLLLAVQGHIVSQNPNDESAAVLLEKIASTKAKLLETTGKAVLNVEVSTHQPPYSLPESWRWARFDTVASIKSNLVPPADFPDHPHLAPDNIEKATGKLLDYRTVHQDGVKSSNHRFFPGQIIYSKIRPNLSKATIVDFEGLCSADMYPVVAHINSRYLLTYILSSVFLGMAVREDTRVAMPKINQEELNQILVAVPPLAEQKRIVAKVDELMRWCDALEARLTAAQTTAEHLLDATLHQILAA